MRISDWSSDVCSSDPCRRHRRHGELTVDVDADALDQWERNPPADRAQDVGSSPTTKPREEQMRTFGRFTVAALDIGISTPTSAAAPETVFQLPHHHGAQPPSPTPTPAPWAPPVDANAPGQEPT